MKGLQKKNPDNYSVGCNCEGNEQLQILVICEIKFKDMKKGCYQKLVAVFLVDRLINSIIIYFIEQQSGGIAWRD